MSSSKAELRSECIDVEETLLGLSEAHLFANDSDSFSTIVERIKCARICAQEGDLSEGHRMLSLAMADIHDAIRKRGRWWSFNNVHAGCVWLYYVSLFCGVISIGLMVDALSFAEDAPTAWNMPIAAMAYGMLGGLVRGMYWLFQKVSDNKYRVVFVVPYIGGPWLASALGLFSYVLARSGVSLFGETSDGTLEYAALAAAAMMAGFSWGWFLRRIKRAQGQV